MVTLLLRPKQEACRESDAIVARPCPHEKVKGRRILNTHNTHSRDPSPNVAFCSNILGVILMLFGIDGGALTCTSSDIDLFISSEKQHSVSPSALLGTLTMLSSWTLVTGLELGSPSLLLPMGRLTLTSFDNPAVVWIALLPHLRLYSLFSALFE